MRLEVWRLHSEADSTLGALFTVRNGRRVFLCWTLEDEFRTVKRFGETCIPPGTYRVTLRTEGGHHTRYATKYPFHRGMLWIRDVPGFEWILIHTGNTDDDTAGCLLVGDVAQRTRIDQSVAAYARIYPPVADAILGGEEVTITYVHVDTPRLVAA